MLSGGKGEGDLGDNDDRPVRWWSDDAGRERVDVVSMLEWILKGWKAVEGQQLIRGVVVEAAGQKSWCLLVADLYATPSSCANA